MSIDEWTAAQRQWLESMGAEIERGRFELTNRYSQAFLARQQALTTARTPAPAAAVIAPAPPVEAAPRPVAAKPTFLAAGAAAEAPAPTMPVVRPPNPLMSGTMSVDASAFRPALPFDPGAQSSVPPAPAAPPVKRAPAALSGTSMAIVTPKGPALPFASTDAPAPAPSAPPAPAPAVKRPPAALSGTSMGFVAPKGPALPFAQGNTQSPSRPADTSAVAPEPPNPLSLEQYASLCVELGADAGKAVETFRRYGLTPEQGQLVDAHWKQRVAADPAVRAAFDRAYDAYRAWLAAARGAPRAPA